MRRVAIRNVRQKKEIERREITTWVDKLIGIPAFIIGNGCSLNDQQLSLLDNYFTIGINRAYKAIDPTILFWQDISLWDAESAETIPKLQAVKVCREAADPTGEYFHFHLRAGAYKFTKQTRILFGSGSSGPIACELAYGLGCSKLVILGMDCKLGPQGQSDFYGDNPHWFKQTLPNCYKGLEYLKNNCPIPIISCSDNDLWPRVSLPEAISQVDPDGRHKLGRQGFILRLRS
jgi:hypothetical protein